jgi:hypothetical protein
MEVRIRLWPHIPKKELISPNNKVSLGDGVLNFYTSYGRKFN